MICEMLFGVGFGLIDDLGGKDAAVFIGGVISYRLGCGVIPRSCFNGDCMIYCGWILYFNPINMFLLIGTVMKRYGLHDMSIFIIRVLVIPCFRDFVCI